MAEAQGFSYVQRKSGDIAISHHGRPAAILRGRKAEVFLSKVGDDDQELMARFTGNYQRGNERGCRRS